MSEHVPTGSDPATVDAYYEHLQVQSVESLNVETWQHQWGPPLLAIGWALSLILFFFLFARYFNRPHRRDTLYGVVSFAGTMLERTGKLSVFSFFVWGATILITLWYVVDLALNGWVY